MTPLSTLCPRLPQIVSASQILMWWLYEFVKAKTKSRNQTFEIPPVTEVQMLDLINKIPSSKAIGCDGLRAKFLKLALPFLTYPLCRLMNISISTGHFPSTWKTAQVTPLFKNGSREGRNNYRPISVLPVLSKILERHVASFLCKYLHSYDWLYNLQLVSRPFDVINHELLLIRSSLSMG